MNWPVVFISMFFTSLFIFLRKRRSDKVREKLEQERQEHLKRLIPIPQPKRTPIRTHSKENCKNCGANAFYDWTCNFCGTKQKEETTNYVHDTSGTQYFDTSGVAYLTPLILNKIIK